MDGQTDLGTDPIQRVLRKVDECGLDYIRCQFLDFIAVARGRAIRREYLPAVMERGLPFAQVNNTTDIDDLEVDLAHGCQAGDFWAVPDPSSFVVLPYATATGHMFTDLVEKDGTPWPTCPRTALRAMAELVDREIGTVRLGFEQEGYLLRQEEDTFVPVHHGKHMAPELLDAEDHFLHDLSSVLLGMGIPLEKMTSEGGLGMFEVNFGAGRPVPSVDQYFRFKQAFRAVARQHGHVGSFMPKPISNTSGAGLHIHLSLVDDASGRDLLADLSDPRGLGLSQLAYRFIAGLLTHAPAITAIGSPSVNSYKRLRPASFAPTHVTYGVGNRSSLVRVVESRTDCGPPPVQRLEVRSPDGTCNPYLLGAVLLASGLDGVRSALDPGPPSSADVGRLSPDELYDRGIQHLPRSLDRALDGLEEDAVIQEIVGTSLFDLFLKAKRAEWEKFSAYITDWEYQQYTEFY